MKMQIKLHGSRKSFVPQRLRFTAFTGLALLTAGLIATSGCSSGSSLSQPQVGAITFTDASGTAAPRPLKVITQGQSTYLDIALTDDSQHLGANWSVYCGSAPPPGTPLPPGQTQDQSCGTFVPAHTMSGPIPSYAASSSGYVTLYTAPAAPPKQGVVTLYAASTSDPSQYASATLTILSKYISVQFATALPATLDVSASIQLTAVVKNDPTNAGVTWSIICASPDCGSVSVAETSSGVATTYTAPATTPVSMGGINAAVQITATSVADPTKYAASTISIVTAGN